MDSNSCSAPITVKDSCLDSWTKIGSGGFGQIYKVRHKKFCFDVAIKLLHSDDGSGKALLRELDMMRQGSSPYVIHIWGVFSGLCPCSPGARLGLVMEFMERGCLASLQGKLKEAPPWPLVFRLAHQVSLGMNFLHNLHPPVLHLDLKPSNVLLDSYINAKLTDFGLAKNYHSVSASCKKDSAKEEGTLSYMPPEAFDDPCYTPTKASDVYSFGILLWSIVTGKQPYPHAMSSIIRMRIPLGDRPSVKPIQVQALEIPGLAPLQDLMEQCWGTEPSERPSFYNCTLVTEELYNLHRLAINSAVSHVLGMLDQTPTEKPRDQVPQTENTERFDPPTGKGPIQEVAEYSVNKELSRSRDLSVLSPVTVPDAELKASPPGPKLKQSSVKPIEKSLPPPPSSSNSKNSPNRSPQATSQRLKSPQYQRYLSDPDASPRHPQAPAPYVNINCSNVHGLQIGNNNKMNITYERRRHPTAPSRVDLHPQHKASEKDKKGGYS